MIDPTLLEMLFMQYAAGGLSSSEALMVASHAVVNPKARKKIAAYEALGGQMMCSGETRAVTPDCLDKIMARIDSDSGEKACHDDAFLPLLADADLHDDIRALIHAHCKIRQAGWQPLSPGIEVIFLKTCDAGMRRLRLVRLAGGQEAPPHHHRGFEITLVLKGGFQDQTGHYRQGDMIVIDDPDFIHAPKADATGCTCLTLTEAPLCFKSTTIRILNFFKRF